MKITCKTTLLPRLLIRGTLLTVSVSDEQPTFGIFVAGLADGHTAVTVDWGDGTVETLPGLDATTHTYAEAGTYEVLLSDDIATLAVSSQNQAEFRDIYPKCLIDVESNAANLLEIQPYGFYRAENLRRVGLKHSAITLINTSAFASCTALESTSGLPDGLTSLANCAFDRCTGLRRIVYLPSGLVKLCASVFRGCTGLSGRIDLPPFDKVICTSTTEPFAQCTGITEIHFKSANEESIRASLGFRQDNTLGTHSATCVFDLV